jgi:hypothetical protein
MADTPAPAQRKPYANVEEAQADLVKHKQEQLAVLKADKTADPALIALTEKHLADATAAYNLTKSRNADAAKAKAK